MTQNDWAYSKVFDRIIAEMEQGNTPWSRCWNGAIGMPHNAATGRHYSGGNVLALWLAGAAYASRGWLTFKQAIAEGCVPRKGEKGTPVFYMNTTVKKKADTNDETESVKSFAFAKCFWVFNVEQLDDLQEGAVAALRARHEPAPVSDFDRLETAERLVTQTGATIKHGFDSASYIPALDVIHLPYAEQFYSRDAYYAVLFHELTHWTSNPSRLNRQVKNKFGSPEYAFEELVAEMGAAFICAHLGIDSVSQSAGYLKNWAAACRQHADLLPHAAALAARAASFIIEGAAPAASCLAA